MKNNTENEILVQEIVSTSREYPRDLPIFYQMKYDKQGFVADIEIIYTKFMQLLELFGYRRFDLKKGFTFVEIYKNVMREVERQKITDCFKDYLNTLPEKLKSTERGAKPFPKEFLINKIYRGVGVYFGTDKLSLLPNVSDEPFQEHTQEKAFFYYKNGFVEVSANGIKLKEYSDLEGLIWKSQILQREFSPIVNDETDLKTASIFGRFIEHITYIERLSEEENKQRYLSLMTLIGYYMHNFIPSDIKIINFTDSSLSTKNEGGTGKSLVFIAISKLIRIATIQGKKFDPDHEFKFQKVEIDDIACLLDDVKPDFRLESLYNETTYGIEVVKKGKNPFMKKMKIAITSNRPIRVEGSSDKRRIIEFEFANFFGADYTPKDHFKHQFFTDWDIYEWNNFDNFMLACVQMYLKHGIIKTEPVALNERKLQNETSQEFLEFMQDLQIEYGKWYDKSELFQSFMVAYPDFDKGKPLKRKTFTSWLQKYGKYTKGIAFNEEIDECRTKTDGEQKLLIRFNKRQ